MRKIILLNILSVTLLSATTYARDAIVFEQWSPPRIVSVNPDGSDFRVIQENAAAFTVSPDKSKMIVFGEDCLKQDICTITAYNLNKSTKSNISRPHAEWLMGKWLSNEEYYVYREVRQDNGGHACGPGDPESGCAARAIIQTAKFNVNSLSFAIDNDYGVGNYEALENHFPSQPQETPPSNSPDNKFLLEWEGSEYWKKALVVAESGSHKKNTIFQRKPADFAEGYSFTTSPWSPDAKLFVLDYYPGGLFYTMFSGKHKIVVVDRVTLRKRTIGKGEQPYWLPSLPSSFIATSKK